MDYRDYVDVPSAKDRFMGNEAMFKKFLYQLPDRNMFQDLEDKLDAGDVKEAFVAAHTLKGLAANLSLKGMEKELHVVVEALRAGNMPEDAQRQALREKYAECVEVIEIIREQNIQLF